MAALKTAIKALDTIKTPRRYMLLYGATASLCILNLVQSVKYPQYNLKVLETYKISYLRKLHHQYAILARNMVAWQINII